MSNKIERRDKPVKISIVGAGNVGATFAYTLLLSGISSEIVMIDVAKTKAEGEVMDLSHAIPFNNPTRITAGDYSDCAGSIVTVIAAGAGQKPGETRLDLARKNAAIFREIVPQVVAHNPEGIIVVATNPVDVLTYLTWQLSGLSAHRVIGSGTILDTARFRYLLSNYYGIDPHSVHAYIIGEHGDSEVPVWSLANIAGMHLPDFCASSNIPYDQTALNNIYEMTRDAANQIITRKGATYYAVASGLLRIVEAIVRDQRTVLSVSSVIEDHDHYGLRNLALSLPTVINRQGVVNVLRLNLSDGETEKLRHSAVVLQNVIGQVQEKVLTLQP